MKGTPRSSHRTIALTTALSVIVLCGSSSAHDPGLSSSSVSVGRHVVHVEILINDADLGAQTLDAAAVALSSEEKMLSPYEIEVAIPSPQHHVLDLWYARRDGSPMTLSLPLLARLPRGHKHYMDVEDVEAAPVSRILSAGADRLELGASLAR